MRGWSEGRCHADGYMEDELCSSRSSSTKAPKLEHASCVWGWEGRFRGSLRARLRVGGVRDHGARPARSVELT